jgi:hypothetical protein
MIPGLLVAYKFFPFLPKETASYMLFCVCSSWYHAMNIFRPRAMNMGSFKLDILSQMFACICNSQLLASRAVISVAFSIFSFVNFGSLPHHVPYVASGASIVIANGGHHESLRYWMICFATFVVSKFFKIPYGHSAFHLIGHKAIALYWISLLK